MGEERKLMNDEYKRNTILCFVRDGIWFGISNPNTDKNNKMSFNFLFVFFDTDGTIIRFPI